MIARNFYERSQNILYPTVDVAGEKTGIVGCEFPILNYLIFLMSSVFGFHDWFGRLINLFVSSIGVLCFYKLIRKYFDEPSAFNSSIILLVSLWFTYSRKTIPDTFAASICLAGLLFAFQFLENGKWYHLLLYTVLGLLGCLSRISAAGLLTVLALPVFLGQYSLQKKVALSICSVPILIGVYWWYFVWVPYLNNTFEYQMFFMGMPLRDGIKALLNVWPTALARLYDTPLKYTGFLTFMAGMFLLIRKKQWLPLATFLLPFLVFLLVIFKSGASIVDDEYYVLMIIPAMALIAGCGLAQVNNKIVVAIVLVAISVEGIANRIHDFRIRQPYAEMEKLEGLMDKVSVPTDRIAINGGAASGTAMFMAHRRGWRVLPELFSDSTYMDYLKQNDCKYVLIIRKHPWTDVSVDLPSVHESEFFKVYKIQ